MGRKIVCPKCSTIFDEDILKVKNSENVCLVCNADLRGNDTNYSGVTDAKPSFGKDVVLGENDSFDEDKIDFWWYEIDEKSKEITYATCAKCGTHTSFLYPIAKMKNYILLNPREHDKCSNCGNELKNHILSKRPENYVDPRKTIQRIQEYENVPHCPICGSAKIHKISATNKAISALAFGMLAAGHISKTYQCDICKSKF